METKTKTAAADLRALRLAGARWEQRSDSHGETRAGWWHGELFLGCTAREAATVLKGGAA